MRACLLALCLLPGPLVAQTLPQGTFDGMDCATPLGTELRLVIGGGTLQFHETQCRVTGAFRVPGLGGVHRYDVSCTGEGEVWAQSYVIAPEWRGGLVLIREGGEAVHYERCDG